MKSAAFCKSLLCLGAVGTGILGARGKVQVTAPSRQRAACGCSPNETLHLFLLKCAFPAAEPDGELVPCSSCNLGLSRHESSQLRPQELPGCSDRGTSLVDPGSPAASEGTCGGSRSPVRPEHREEGSCPPELPVSCLLPGLVSDPPEQTARHFSGLLRPQQLPHTFTQQPPHPGSHQCTPQPQ